MEMKNFLKFGITTFILTCSLNAVTLDTDTTALQKLRDVCGTYFGATVPLGSLTTITDAQINAKLSATDFNSITDLLANAATFYANTTYLPEITIFQTKTQTLKTAATQVNPEVTAIGTMNMVDLTTRIGTITTSTDTQIINAITSRIGVLFTNRASNQNKPYYTDLINMLKAAQAKFTIDTTYAGKILSAALESVGFETDKIAALMSIFSDTTYTNYVNTANLGGLAYSTLTTVCTLDQLPGKSIDELNQLFPMLQAAETFLGGAAKKNDVSNLRKNCQIQLQSKNLIANATPDAINQFITQVISNSEFNSIDFSTIIYNAIISLYSAKVTPDLIKLMPLAKIDLTTLTSIQSPALINSIDNLLTNAKDKAFLSGDANTIDSQTTPSQKNAIFNLFLNIKILSSLVPAGFPAKLNGLNALAGTAFPGAISPITQRVFASSVLSVAMGGAISNTDATLKALLTSAETNKLISATDKAYIIQSTPPAVTTAAKTTAKAATKKATKAAPKTTTSKATSKAPKTTAKTTAKAPARR